MADGNAIKVTPKNFANLFRGIAMLDLGGFALDEGSVPAQLRHAGFEGTARACAAEEKQHSEGLITQVSVRFIEGTLALEVPSHIQNSFDLFLAEIQVADQIPAT